MKETSGGETDMRGAPAASRAPNTVRLEDHKRLGAKRHEGKKPVPASPTCVASRLLQEHEQLCGSRITSGLERSDMNERNQCRRARQAWRAGCLRSTKKR